MDFQLFDSGFFLSRGNGGARRNDREQVHQLQQYRRRHYLHSLGPQCHTALNWSPGDHLVDGVELNPERLLVCPVGQHDRG